MVIFLNAAIQKQVKEFFVDLENPVAIILFKSVNQSCEYCQDTEQLLIELVDLSSKLSLTVYDLDNDAPMANEFHIDKAPGFVLARVDGKELVDYGIRFYGIPAGSEFGALINALLMVSNRQSGLAEQTRSFLSTLTKPVHLMVFVTPT
jgi:glutaredoxin-like protein